MFNYFTAVAALGVKSYKHQIYRCIHYTVYLLLAPTEGIILMTQPVNGTGLFSHWVKWPEREANHPLCVIPVLITRGAVFSVPHTPLWLGATLLSTFIQYLFGLL
jgi:hypothetical protein